MLLQQNPFRTFSHHCRGYQHMRETGTPSVLVADGRLQQLTRVDLRDRDVPEAFLQDAINRSPQILPVEEVDPAFGPLVSLGREIDSIDNLFVSPTGRITLVETKLWRNPQAAREVVAQTLEYATRLSSWAYSDLEDAARKALPPAPIGNASLYQHVAARFPKDVLPEGQFIDEVQKDLRTGRFLLLVVGDGIRENLDGMFERLHSHPHMLFTFRLVEVRVYKAPDPPGGLLLMPVLVARTTEIVRSVVRVETAAGRTQVSVTVAPEEKEGGPARRTLTEDLFFSEIKDESTRTLFRRLLDFIPEIGAEPVWRSAAVSVQLPDPKGSVQMLTLFVLATNGDVYLGCLAGQLKRVGLDAEIATDFVKSVASLFPGVTPHRKLPDSLSRSIKASELQPQAGAFMEIVRKTASRIAGGAGHA
jgi:hypothetical protein